MGSMPVAEARFDDEEYGLSRQPHVSVPAVPIDGPEDGAGLDPRGGTPRIEGEDEAVAGSAGGDSHTTSGSLLVGLRVPEL